MVKIYYDKDADTKVLKKKKKYYKMQTKKN